MQSNISYFAMNSQYIQLLLVSYIVQFVLSGKLSKKFCFNVNIRTQINETQPKYCQMNKWSKQCYFSRKFQWYLLRWYGLFWNDFQQRIMSNCWYQWKMLFFLLSLLPRSVGVQIVGDLISVKQLLKCLLPQSLI